MGFELHCSRYDHSKRIRDLGLSWVFSQSENGALGCPRKYAYGYVQAYQVGSKGKALIHGIVWHRMCEEFLLNIEELKEPEAFSDFVHVNLNAWIWQELDDLKDINENQKQEWFDHIHKNISNGCEGWRRHWMERIYLMK